MSSKALEKAKKVLGQASLDEMDAMDLDSLKLVIVHASSAMRTAKEELEANLQYQGLKESLKDLTSAKRELDSRQKAKIAYALELLEAKGQ